MARSRLRTLGRVVFLTGFTAVVLVFGLSWALTRTGLGQDVVLRQALDRIGRALNGTLTVGQVRSRQILFGGTFIDVAIADASGRPFLVADSVAVSYSIPALLTGNIRLTRLELFRPRVTIERLPEQSRFNVMRIFAGRGADADSTGAAADTLQDVQVQRGDTRVVFRRVRFHDGRVVVRYPLTGAVPERGGVERLPGVDPLMRRISFDQVEGLLDEMRLVDPAFPGPLFVVDDLSLNGTLFSDPFHIERFSGTVAWEDGEIVVDAPVLNLTDTRTSGGARISLAPGGAVMQADLRAEPLHLDDLRWAVPLLPAGGQGAADLSLNIRPGVIRVTFRDADVGLGESRVLGEGTVELTDDVTLEGIDLTLDPLDMALLAPYLPSDSVPVRGRLRGRFRAAGPMSGPWVSAQVTLDQSLLGRGPTVVDASGIVYLDGSPGFADFQALLEPAQLDLVTDLVPRLGLRGLGGIDLVASGRLDEGLRFTADLTHRPVGLPRSRVRATGSIQNLDGELALDVDATLDPLSFTAWRAYAPDLPVSGEVSGTVRAEGLVSELRVISDLETVAGSMSFDAVIDARNPLAAYRLTGGLRDFRLSELLPTLPKPSTVTGTFEAQGRGGSLEDATGSAQVDVHDSRLGKVGVDTAAAQVRLAGGYVHFDTLTARTTLMDLEAAGRFALGDSLDPGRIDAQFSSPTLEGIRPFLMGDSLIARDTLSFLELAGLRVEGVDPDTLPVLEDIVVDGRAEGRFTVIGSTRSFDIDGSAELTDLRYAESRIGSASLDFGVQNLPGNETTVRLAASGEAIDVAGRIFQSGRVEGERSGRQGRVVLAVQRSPEEEYNARATFELDSARAVVNLDELSFRFPNQRWNLGGPARITWGDQHLAVEEFRLRTADGQGLDLDVDGTIGRGEESDLLVDARRLPLQRLAHVLQLDRAGEISGELDARLSVRGTVDAPRIVGSVRGTGVGYESIDLDRIEGALEYADRILQTEWTAERGSRSVLRASGSVPVDLSWQSDDRVPDDPVDLEIAVDSFPARLALGLLDALEDVDGTLSGAFDVRGTVVSPAPSGTLRLREGAAVIPALGVRYSGVGAELRLSPDGTVEVQGSLRSVGTMDVTGTVMLDTLSNPLLDLRATARQFLAADRADVLASAGGTLSIQGRYQRPLVQGDIQVESGALYLREIQRTAAVVDLYDPLFRDVVDTTLIASQPLLAAGENPFLRNLRLDVDLALDRNFWLRSPEMNVEIEGDLQVFWDRTNRDLAMLGELQAVRGTYSRFGRQFQVQQGTVRFIGTPGLDPDLNILAVNRLRVRDGEPLNIFALLEGTLLRPRVTLSSDAQPPIASSELVSYLIFGRPTYELASAEFSLVQGEFGGIFGSAAGAGASLAFGALGTQLGSAVAQQIGLDYFAISQAQGSAQIGTGFESALRATQVEVGWYVAQDVFLALLLRPLLGINSGGVSGARLEWRATDLWTVEAFLEDRFARELNTGFSINDSFQVPKVWGLFLAREWGY